MLAEVKKCADNHDIKGLRYIFVDSLDVDPTFEKYRDDYEYCKKIPGLFDVHQELNEMIDNQKCWNKEYWEQLKLDLMKNFSEKRFNHMINVAKVVYSDKIARLVSERNEKKEGSKDQTENIIQHSQKKSAKVNEKRKKVDESSYRAERKSSISKLSAEDERKIAIRKKEIEEENKRVEAKKREEQERIAAKKLASQRSNDNKEVYSSKKWLGIVGIVAIVIVVLIILALQGNNLR